LILQREKQPKSAGNLTGHIKHIIEVERQVDWDALIALRKQLRLLSPELFSLYMARRAPGDWRWQIDEG
jgi:hypothetical protein